MKTLCYNKSGGVNMDIKKVLEKVKKEMNLSDEIVEKIGKIISKNFTDKDSVINELCKKLDFSEADAKKIYEKVKSALSSEATKNIADKVMGLFGSKK